jgi:hypothetical protein
VIDDVESIYATALLPLVTQRSVHFHHEYMQKIYEVASVDSELELYRDHPFGEVEVS